MLQNSSRAYLGDIALGADAAAVDRLEGIYLVLSD